ncbi:YqkE family protein [Sporosarcina thermotolerans]|uniref:YqkE family protein n=1 Tax=Sporosarcina thermotolerans TaxID=633404 RepID=A0AAW9A4D8_9BACL|nr:YqkE family protein [Sporosarcina thermotolerans]MDW0115629.1 YqkE family protein [Sporosarcina thermotolerans]WHT47082.1 YqkE family protein [Sporosarcina thermotolerans]
MAKKKTKKQLSPKKQENEKATLMDSLDNDIVDKLKEAKKELLASAQAKEEERLEKIRKEKLEREKNKSFAELLDEYGDSGSKF